MKQYFFYKGNVYQFLDTITTKHPATREWEPYALYQNSKGQLFSRELGEFYALFSEVKEPLKIAEFETILSIK